MLVGLPLSPHAPPANSAKKKQGRLLEVHLLLLVHLGLVDLLLARLLIALPLRLAADQRLLPLLVACRYLM